MFKAAVIAGAIMIANAGDGTPLIIHSKPKFSERHPRIYRVYRCGRKVCLAFKPFLDVAAASAQIVTPFVIH